MMMLKNTNYNGMSAGTVAVANGVTLTIADGSRLVVV